MIPKEQNSSIREGPVTRSATKKAKEQEKELVLKEVGKDTHLEPEDFPAEDVFVVRNLLTIKKSVL